MSNKFAHDFTGLGLKKSKKREEQRKAGTLSNGYACSELIEPVPNYKRAGCEVVNFDQTGTLAAKNNCWVILGRDRVDMEDTGYGGRGDTQAGAIYICAGMSSAKPYEVNVPTDGTPTDTARVTEATADRSFQMDASFIYLSQKSDIDNYLHLGGSTQAQCEDPSAYSTGEVNAILARMSSTRFHVKKAPAPSAAIAIKSDNVRIVGRESIRIQVNAEARGDGKNRERGFGIALCGGGAPHKCEPVVKGYQMLLFVDKLKNVLNTIQQNLHHFYQDQTSFNNLVAAHDHVNGPLGKTELLTPFRLMMKAQPLKMDATLGFNNLSTMKDIGSIDDFTNDGHKYLLSQNVFCD